MRNIVHEIGIIESSIGYESTAKETLLIRHIKDRRS
jgi:hypothetical protein